MLPAVLAAIIAPTGLYVYLHFQKRAEGIVLAKQKRYQEALLAASRGMTLIKDLDKLNDLLNSSR